MGELALAGPDFAIWAMPISFGRLAHALTLSLIHWINDGLMASFFLVVGLELKRELLAGELASPRQAMLPIVAAFGGVALPAAVYAGLNAGGGAAAARLGHTDGDRHRVCPGRAATPRPEDPARLSSSS